MQRNERSQIASGQFHWCGRSTQSHGGFHLDREPALDTEFHTRNVESQSRAYTAKEGRLSCSILRILGRVHVEGIRAAVRPILIERIRHDSKGDNEPSAAPGERDSNEELDRRLSTLYQVKERCLRFGKMSLDLIRTNQNCQSFGKLLSLL